MMRDDDTPILDLRGHGELPRLALPWLNEPEPVRSHHARRFWAQQLMASEADCRELEQLEAFLHRIDAGPGHADRSTSRR